MNHTVENLRKKLTGMHLALLQSKRNPGAPLCMVRGRGRGSEGFGEERQRDSRIEEAGKLFIGLLQDNLLDASANVTRKQLHEPIQSLVTLAAHLLLTDNSSRWSGWIDRLKYSASNSVLSLSADSIVFLCMMCLVSFSFSFTSSSCSPGPSLLGLSFFAFSLAEVSLHHDPMLQ